MQIRSLAREDPLKEGMANLSGILAWEISWTERSLAGYIPWNHKESDMIESFYTPLIS